MHEPGGQTATDDYDLVRPYVRGGDGPWPPPRSAQYDDPFAPRLLGSRTEPGWPGDPTPAGPARPEPGWRPAHARHRAPRGQSLAGWSLAGWSLALRRRLRPAAIGAVAAIIAIAGTLIGLLPAGRTGRCAGRPCHATAAGLSRLSPGRPTGSARPTAAPVRASARPSLPPPAASAPAAGPSELTPTWPAVREPTSATLAPTTIPPLAGVTVSYTMVRFWGNGFEGELTIVNGGTAPVADWQLAVALPGDRVLAAWDARVRATGPTMVLTPRTHRAVIEPGASVSAHFIVSGTDVSSQGCTLNGVPCS